jgi:hypothetical protein
VIAGPRPDVEHCDGCGVALPAEHDHLAEAGARALRCACAACAMTPAGPAGVRLKRVRRRVERLLDGRISAPTWAALGVPVGLAFFVRRWSGVVALYPSPAGLLEADVAAAAWEAVTTEHPSLADLDDDVEALLVNRLHGADAAYRVSVDFCYRLAGLVRLHWRGLGGGSALAQQVRTFFEELDRG